MDDPDQLPFVDPAAPPATEPGPGFGSDAAPVPAEPVAPGGPVELGGPVADAIVPGTEVPAPVEEPPAADAGPPASAGRSFQASAGIQGRQFAEQCDTLLAHLGYELRGRRVLPEVGVEIDQEAVSPAGVVVWFEYKGSIQGNRPGLRRTDTMKKAIANGALLRGLADPAPYVVITSHLPEAGSGAAMLQTAVELRYLADVVCLYDPSSTTRLKRW